MKEETNEFQVSADEMEYLKQLTSGDESFTGLLRSQTISPSGKVAVRLRPFEAEQLRDRLTTELASRGFDENYSPNNLGRMLEALIDRFFVV